jgi:hypothetical protein
MRLGELRLALAVLAVAELLMAVYLWLPRQPESQRVEEVPGLDGFSMVFVNGELRCSRRVDSFSDKAAVLLAAAMFPTSRQRAWNVTLQSYTITFYGGSRFSTAWGGAWSVSPAWSNAPFLGYQEWGDARSYPYLMPAEMYVYTANSGDRRYPKTVVRLAPPAVAANGSGVYVFYGATVVVGWKPDWGDFDMVSKVEVYRPHGGASWANEPVFTENYWYTFWPQMDGEVKIRDGDALTLLYAFKFGEPYTVNWGKLFAAWLHNAPFTVYELTATDGSTVLVNATWAVEWQGWMPLPGGGGWSWATNFTLGMVPERVYVVVGDGQAQFSPFAYRVASEVARAEPTVQVVGKAVKLSARFVLDRDVTVRETAVYAVMPDGKEVMILYRVLPQPVAVKAGQPFTTGFEVRLP